MEYVYILGKKRYYYDGFLKRLEYIINKRKINLLYNMREMDSSLFYKDVLPKDLLNKIINYLD